MACRRLRGDGRVPTSTPPRHAVPHPGVPRRCGPTDRARHRFIPLRSTPTRWSSRRIRCSAERTRIGSASAGSSCTGFAPARPILRRRERRSRSRAEAEGATAGRERGVCQRAALRVFPTSASAGSHGAATLNGVHRGMLGRRMVDPGQPPGPPNPNAPHSPWSHVTRGHPPRGRWPSTATALRLREISDLHGVAGSTAQAALERHRRVVAEIADYVRHGYRVGSGRDR